MFSLYKSKKIFFPLLGKFLQAKMLNNKITAVSQFSVCIFCTVEGQLCHYAARSTFPIHWKLKDTPTATTFR